MIDDMNFYRNLVVDHLIGDECKTWFEEIDIPSLGVEKVRFSRDDEYHEPILTEDFIEYSANKIKNAPSGQSYGFNVNNMLLNAIDDVNALQESLCQHKVDFSEDDICIMLSDFIQRFQNRLIRYLNGKRVSCRLMPDGSCTFRLK